MNMRLKTTSYFFMITTCVLLFPLAIGQHVEPVDAFRFSGVLLYDYNAFTRSLAVVGRDGTVLLLSPEERWTSRVDPRGLRAVYALEKGLLLQREDSLELFSFREGSKTLFTCKGLEIRRVYSRFAVIDCGRPMLLDLYEGKTTNLAFNIRPLNAWRYVVALDLDRFTMVVLTERGWESVSYSLTADVAFSMEGERGVYVILADGSVLLLDPTTITARLLSRVKPSPPAATVRVDGVEHLVLRDGTMINEHGKVETLRFGVAFIVTNGGFFALTDDGRLLFREKPNSDWFGPLVEFADPVLAVIPARQYTEAPAVMVTCVKGTDLEILTIGFRDYSLTVNLRQEWIYALEMAEIVVEVDRGGGVSGAVLLYEADRIFEKVSFETLEKYALIQVQPSIPGCYDIFIEIAPRGYYPSKRVHVGRLCVRAKPINCQLQALRGDIEEGEEIALKLRVLDALSGNDVTSFILAKLLSLNVSHILPDGSTEMILQSPSDTLRLRLRGVGSHKLSVSLPPTGPYSGCTTDPVTVDVKGVLNLPLIGAALVSTLLGTFAGVYYARTKTRVWRGIERAVLAGANCDELTKRLSGILPESVARTACEFVSDYRIVFNSMSKLLATLRPLHGMSRIRDTVTQLESLAREIGACRNIYLRGDPENALKRLNELKSKLHEELLILASALESERNKLEEERKKLEEYLNRLEQYKDKASVRAYLKLKGEYESKLRHVRDELSNIETVLATLKDAAQCD